MAAEDASLLERITRTGRALALASLFALPLVAASPAAHAVNASKTFTPSTIASGGTSQLRITISGNAPSVSFGDGFPAGMTRVAESPILGTCGPVSVNSNSLSVKGGRGGNGCFVEITVTATAAQDTVLTNLTSRISYILCPDGCFTFSSGPAGATLTVLAPDVPPQITSPCPPPGRVGDPYAFNVAATGRPAPTLSASGLPPGLTLDPAGALTGTPTQSGAFAPVITAKNGIAPDAMQQCTLVIASNDLPPAINSPCPPFGDVGVAYAFQVGTTGRPVPTLVATGLPAGLTLGAGGALTGTPTQGGDFPLVFTAQNGVPPDAVQHCTLTIRRAATTMTLKVDPIPAVSGQTVTAIATVSGPGAVPQGAVALCVVGTGFACPPPLGAPGTAPTRPALSAALDGQGVARFSLTGLGIDNFLVSALYGGDAGHDGSGAGPVEEFVIKGALLAAPKVALEAPASVGPGATIATRVTVAPSAPGLVPTGMVALTSGGQTLVSAALVGGEAALAFGAPASGTIEIAAEYAGDGAFPPAVSSPVSVAVVAKAGLSDPNQIPALSDLALLWIALALAVLGAHRLRPASRPRSRN